MSRRAIYSELRWLRKQVAMLRRQRSQTLIPGVVEAVKGDRVQVRLMDQGSDGKPVLTPFIRMAANTGHRGSGVSEFTKYGVGETVLVASPNGQLGTMSAAMPWISTEDDPAPGQAEQDGRVITIGSARLSMKDGDVQISVGGAIGRFRPNAINLLVGGSEIVLSGGAILIRTGDVIIQSGSLTHNGKNVGSTHTNSGLPVD